MMNQNQANPFSISDSDPYVGMSDEEELRRMGMVISGSQPVGEVFVEIEDDLSELGFRRE